MPKEGSIKYMYICWYVLNIYPWILGTTSFGVLTSPPHKAQVCGSRPGREWGGLCRLCSLNPRASSHSLALPKSPDEGQACSQSQKGLHSKPWRTAKERQGCDYNPKTELPSDDHHPDTCREHIRPPPPRRSLASAVPGSL